ncbi:hypothetical protein THIX_60085 [Thiomonas sp. X19]|nr:hypothetical protein THIX_60085 [Thiomonas sp. X19]
MQLFYTDIVHSQIRSSEIEKDAVSPTIRPTQTRWLRFRMHPSRQREPFFQSRTSG